MIAGDNISSLLFNRKEHPFGRSWQYWTTRWWQWFLSIPKVDSPALNTTGKKFSDYQRDPNVWFLTSTMNSVVECNVRIPSGKGVLFPVINVTISNAEDPTLNTDADMISFVNGHMDDIVEKRANIDGEDVFISENNNRVNSPPFKFSFPPDNIFGAREGPTTGVGDGYWIFMKPLQEGIHTIKTFGSCMSGKVQIAINIKLIIEKIHHNCLHGNFSPADRSKICSQELSF
jgi:hypothetical protein